MKKILIIFSILSIAAISYFIFHPYFTKEPQVLVPVDVTAPSGEVNYRKVTFIVKELTSDTVYFKGIDYLGVEETEQYLIVPTLEGHPSVWMTQERLPLSTKLEEGREYTVVTKSYDKKLVDTEEYHLNFNDYFLANEAPF